MGGGNRISRRGVLVLKMGIIVSIGQTRST